jgi:hypothetical protein
MYGFSNCQHRIKVIKQDPRPLIPKPYLLATTKSVLGGRSSLFTPGYINEIGKLPLKQPGDAHVKNSEEK